MINSIVLMGRITKDIDLKQVSSGISVCKFSIAVERRFKDKLSGEKITDFIDCQAWRGTADFIARYFGRGDMIAVEGTLNQNNWTDNSGNKRYSYIVVVDQAHFCGSKNDSAQSGTAQPDSAQPAPAQPDTSIEQFAAAVEVTSQDVPF